MKHIAFINMLVELSPSYGGSKIFFWKPIQINDINKLWGHLFFSLLQWPFIFLVTIFSGGGGEDLFITEVNLRWHSYIFWVFNCGNVSPILGVKLPLTNFVSLDISQTPLYLWFLMGKIGIKITLTSWWYL